MPLWQHANRPGEPLRVDVMRPLASARVVLRAEELRYSVPLEGKQVTSAATEANQ